MSLVENKEHMKLITVHLPEQVLAFIAAICEVKWFPNRSEFIRVAIYQLIQEWKDVL